MLDALEEVELHQRLHDVVVDADLAPASPVARLLSVLCGAAGIGTFGLLIASVTKKVMYR